MLLLLWCLGPWWVIPIGPPTEAKSGCGTPCCHPASNTTLEVLVTAQLCFRRQHELHRAASVSVEIQNAQQQCAPGRPPAAAAGPGGWLAGGRSRAASCLVCWGVICLLASALDEADSRSKQGHGSNSSPCNHSHRHAYCLLLGGCGSLPDGRGGSGRCVIHRRLRLDWCCCCCGGMRIDCCLLRCDGCWWRGHWHMLRGCSCCHCA